MNLWRSVAVPTEHIPGLPQVRCVARGIERDAGYRLSGLRRPDHDHAVFQYTLGGRGVFHDAYGSYSVSPGQGFLCMANEPGVRYQYPPDASEAWDFVFVTWIGMKESVAYLTQQNPIFQIDPKHRLIQELLGWERYHNAPVSMSAGLAARLAQLTINTLIDSRHHVEPTLYDELTTDFLNLIKDADAVDQVDAAAHLLGVSREHLSRTVKAHTGITVREHLQRRRIQRACAMLETSDASIHEIAARSGFHDGSHLARLFRKFMGMTPHAYKVALQKGNDWSDPESLL